MYRFLYKNDERGYFFEAGVCASLSPFRLKEKNAIILVGKVFFINLLTRCDYWVISQIHHYFLISQNRFFDILDRFGILVLKNSYRREKLIAKLKWHTNHVSQHMKFRSCCKGTDCANVTRQHTRCPHICHSNRYLRRHMGLWYLSYCRVPKAQASLCKYADSTEPSLIA